MKAKLFLILTIILLIAMAVGAYFLFGSFSNGTRAGVVIKMSKKGVIFKTYEGELNTGGFADSDGQLTSSIWAFSVVDDQVVRDLSDAELSGQRVKLHYNEKFYKLFFRGDTKYFVNKVEPYSGQLK